MSAGAALRAGACIPDAQVTLPNGITNTGGEEVLGANKTGFATLTDYGLTSASDISVVYNPSQEGGAEATTITDITIKFFGAAGNFVIAVDNASNLDFATENPGSGGAGFALVLDAAQAALVDAAFGGSIAGAVLTVEATITGSNDGPDTFALVNLAAPPVVPEPASLALLGTALLGFGIVDRRKRG